MPEILSFSNQTPPRWKRTQSPCLRFGSKATTFATVFQGELEETPELLSFPEVET
jgi:hypothetical protein